MNQKNQFEVHQETKIIDGSIVIGVREQILYSFNLVLLQDINYKSANHCFIQKETQNEISQYPLFRGGWQPKPNIFQQRDTHFHSSIH